jgi:hypothetical protein
LAAHGRGEHRKSSKHFFAARWGGADLDGRLQDADSGCAQPWPHGSLWKTSTSAFGRGLRTNHVTFLNQSLVEMYVPQHRTTMVADTNRRSTSTSCARPQDVVVKMGGFHARHGTVGLG